MARKPKEQTIADAALEIADDFSTTYREIAFSLWYKAGRPSLRRLVTVLPVAEENGKVPTKFTLENWLNMYDWPSRADVMDAEVAREVERMAIKEKIDMLRRHAEAGQKLIARGMAFLDTFGIDKSADAIRAIVAGMDAERLSRGLQIALGELEDMSNEQLVRFVEQKISAAASASSESQEDAIEGVVQEVDDGEAQSE